MGLLKATIGGVDVTAYLKEPLTTNPGSAGTIGDATLVLDQEAGGLDIRARMDVKVWVPYDTTAGTGVASRGRKFGGLVASRQTGNIGTTKTWQLKCEDWNCLLDLIQKDFDQGASWNIFLASADFNVQIASLVAQIQENGHGVVNTPIDTTTVPNLYSGMPTVFYEGGHSLGYYIQQHCNKVKALDPTIVPRFFIGQDSTFGALETFGGPVLYIFDYALTPTADWTYSDTPGGGEKSVFGQFKRTTDASGARVIQRRQGVWNGDSYTSVNDTSQGLYPCPYINHGKASNSGYWGAKPITIDAVNAGAAQAVVDASIASTAYPLDTLEWETEEAVQPYDTIELKWDLEGIPAHTQYRIAKLSTRWEGLSVITRATLNNRRRGILDDGSDEYPTAPIEGDNVGPLAPTSITKTSETWDPLIERVRTEFSVGKSPSPDAVRYLMFGKEGGVDPFQEDAPDLTGDPFTYVHYFRPSLLCNLGAQAFDSSGNPGGLITVTPWTSISKPGPPAAPTIGSITDGMEQDGFYYMDIPVDHAAMTNNLGGWVKVTLGGVDTLEPIPVNTSFPVTVRVLGLLAGFLYSVSAQVQEEYGQWSAFTSPPATHTITAIYGPLDNGGFEGLKHGDATMARAWSRGTPYSHNEHVEIDDTDSYAGIRSMKFTHGTVSALDNPYIVSDRFELPAEGPQSFVVRMYGKGGAGGESALLRLSVYARTGGLALATYDLFPTFTTSWAYYELVTLPTAANAVLGEITIGDTTGGTSAKHWWADAVTIEPVVSAQASGAMTPAQKTLLDNVATGGTSFPGSPSAGDTFFRSDLGMWCYYDGTRWLGPEYALSGWQYYPDANNAYELTAAGTIEHLYVALRSDRALHCTRWAVEGYVNGTSDSTNYWEIKLRTFSGLVNLQTTPMDTKAWTATTWTRAEVTTFNTQPATTDQGLEVVVTKHSSPGGLRLAHTLWVRDVVT